MVILCLYVQTVIRQCFCFPNSQWGATTHDNIPQPNLISDSGLGKCSPIAIRIERIKYMQRRNK